MSRRSILIASIVVSVGLHVTLVAMSSSVVIFAKSLTKAEPIHPFNIRVLDEAAAPPAEEEFGGPGRVVVSRPGSIEDLLRRETENLQPAEDLLGKRVDVPLLSERVAAEKPEAAASDTTELAENPDVLDRIDTKIIEISEAEARKDIQVARRLVAPSPTRVVEVDQFPLLRGAANQPADSAAVPEEVLLIDPLATGLPAASAEPPAGMDTPEGAPPAEPDALEQLPQRVLPDLLIETTLARRPIADAIAHESPREFMDDLVNVELRTYVPQGSGKGYFRLRVVPKVGPSSSSDHPQAASDDAIMKPLPKDVTFVVDASSSILQRKLDATVAGVRQAIGKLRPDDRFNIVMFRDTPSTFQPQPVPATPENKKAALQFLTGQQSRGETDVYQALHLVVQEPSRAGVPAIVFVASDGRPTTGLRDARAIINTLTDENQGLGGRSACSIFAFGGGTTVNRYLLDLLAYRNRGATRVTDQIDAISQDLPKFFGELSDPILVDCRVEFGASAHAGIDEADVFPKQLPDFFKGRVVTLYGTYDPAQAHEFAIRLTGMAGPNEKEVIFKADLRKAATDTNAQEVRDIPRNWALGKIYALIDQICLEGETPELLAELRELSRSYGIKTSYDP